MQKIGRLWKKSEKWKKVSIICFLIFISVGVISNENRPVEKKPEEKITQKASKAKPSSKVEEKKRA